MKVSNTFTVPKRERTDLPSAVAAMMRRETRRKKPARRPIRHQHFVPCLKWTKETRVGGYYIRQAW